LQFKKLGDIVAATVLQMLKFTEYRHRNYEKALYDFRQKRLSENFTQNVIRKKVRMSWNIRQD